MDEMEQAKAIHRLTAFSRNPSVSKHRDSQGKTADESLDFGQRCLVDQDYEGAIKHFKKALQQGAGSDAASALAGAYEATDQDSDALEQYLKLISKEDDPDIAVAISDIKRRSGKLTEALEPLEESLAAHPDQPYLHYKIADTLRQFGHRAEAVEPVTEAIRLAPEDRFYRWWLGELLYTLGRFKEAAQSTSAAIELGEQEAGVWRTLALALWGADQGADALVAIRKAVERTDAGGECAILMAEMLAASGQDEEAHKLLQPPLDAYDVENARLAVKPLVKADRIRTRWI